MPKRKKLPKSPDYAGLPRHESLMLVQKSSPLLSLTQTAMTLPELKILDVYLSRIDSHHPEKRYVRLERGELEKLLGVVRIPKDELEKRLDNLFQVVTIRDPEKPRGFEKIGLFERAKALQDEAGLWQVDLACTPAAMEYIFDVEDFRYLKYRLHSVINLQSRYSYALFLYLEDNRYRKTWEVSLDELKIILRCSGSSYDRYKEVNDKILKRAQAEIQDKTECRFSYDPVRKGRKVTAVRFSLETKSDQIKGQLGLEEVFPDAMLQLDPPDPDADRPEHIAFLADATCPRGSRKPEFSDVEVEDLFQLIVTVPENKLPHVGGIGGEDIDIRRYHYLAQKYAQLNAAAERRQIKDRFAYLRRMIEKEVLSGE